MGNQGFKQIAANALVAGNSIRRGYGEEGLVAHYGLYHLCLSLHSAAAHEVHGPLAVDNKLLVLGEHGAENLAELLFTINGEN